MDTKTITDFLLKIWTVYYGFIDSIFHVGSTWSQLIGGLILSVIIYLIITEPRNNNNGERTTRQEPTIDSSGS